MAELKKADFKGMHGEQLLGRTQQRFFDVDGGSDGFVYPLAYEVDFNKRA